MPRHLREVGFENALDEEVLPQARRKRLPAWSIPPQARRKDCPPPVDPCLKHGGKDCPPPVDPASSTAEDCSRLRRAFRVDGEDSSAPKERCLVMRAVFHLHRASGLGRRRLRVSRRTEFGGEGCVLRDEPLVWDGEECACPEGLVFEQGECVDPGRVQTWQEGRLSATPRSTFFHCPRGR